MLRTIVSSLAALVLLVPPQPRAAPPVLHGTTTSHSGAPVEGALITVRGTSLGVLSGRDGRFRTSLPESLRGTDVVVEARAIGYERAALTLRLTGDTLRADFVLQPSVVALDEVVVTGQPEVAKRVKVGMAVATIAQANSPQPEPPRGNTEGYDRIEDNAFRTARSVPLSTFSIDVDRASYANVRRFLAEGQLPPVDAVRLEELVNYFPYEYAAPTHGAPVRFTTDVAAAPWAPAHRLVRIALQAQRVPLADVPPSNLVFLLDVSGSMAEPNKLPLVKEALEMLVGQLRAMDRVAVVVYAGAAGLVLPSTPGTNKATIRSALERLEAGGSTAGGAGIRLAYQVAQDNFIPGGNNRVILATDGDFNVGASSDAEMERLIEEKREGGTFLTVLGFGMGNYKDSKLEKLADRGNGNYAYIDSPLEARKVFVHEFGGTMLTVAKDVKLQVEFNAARVRSWRLLGYENRLLNDEDFTDDRKDAGDMGSGHSVTALYEIVPQGSAIGDSVEQSALRYREEPAPSRRARSNEIMQVSMRWKERDGHTSRELRAVVEDRVVPLRGDFAFASSVAEFAMVLRDSRHRGASSLAAALERASESRGRDELGYRREFIQMIQKTMDLRSRLAAVER